ncbi:MAG: SusD/RagB family nutrient-binding outer membrane lipoprotein [Bacteroidales bacterium]|nr:SusD/RagB family nutrient-binding outer membrane lipoprotein [Bacteroidales bacterium]MCF8458000.1 SusD/RagB family nutrient-binding outer membrane lipoprotein [Bacteroidales bacterium]
MKGKITILLTVLLGSILLNSCRKDFEDINTDPDDFVTANSGSLLNGITGSLRSGVNERFYVHIEVLYKQSQLGTLTKEAWSTYTLGTKEMWKNYYGTLPNFRELERRFDALPPSAEVTNMRAIVKILLAYTTFKVTDLFGDIPFSEAGYGFISSENLHPIFDTQESIYLYILDELKWCEENIDPSATEDPYKTFAVFENIFNGDLAKWKMFANSLRMRHAMRIVNKNPDLAAEIIGDIMNNNKPLIGELEVDSANIDYSCVALWPYKLNYFQGWWEFYEHKNVRMGSNLWHQFSENDNTDGSGIFDPRVYYFFETNNDNEWAAFPQIVPTGTAPDEGAPYGSQRNFDASFAIKGDGCVYSPFNYFLVSDGYNSPNILISGAEVHFLKAEAYLRGIGVAQNEAMAQTEFENGIKLSLDFWKFTAEHLKLSQGGYFSSKITVPSNLDFDSVNDKMGFSNVSSTDDKLKLIYTQRWIDMFRQIDQAFALCRRTMKTPREGSPLEYFRLPIPDIEKDNNLQNYESAYSAQGDFSTTKVWWME